LSGVKDLEGEITQNQAVIWSIRLGKEFA
jgi:hypothetical protein